MYHLFWGKEIKEKETELWQNWFTYVTIFDKKFAIFGFFGLVGLFLIWIPNLKFNKIETTKLTLFHFWLLSDCLYGYVEMIMCRFRERGEKNIVQLLN